DRPALRPVAPLAQLDFDEPEVPAATAVPVVATPAVSDGPVAEPRAEQPRARRGKPAVPAWEDVLLGVRSSGQR
ncbi:MAG: hypothetical protein QOE12_923, partial [Mycobacterium sp.]|nr:hypothetical protein [Mycobacterium sp.]